MISLSINGFIATITLCRPPVNAINEEWLDCLDSAVDEIQDNTAVSVVWIRSSERAFCAGADLALMSSRFDTKDGQDLMISFVRRIQQVYARLENMSAVSVAEISGAAMGGGLELALACDLRVIANTARIGLPEAGLGLLPGAGGTQRMTRQCGDDVARRLILGGEIIDGKTARELRVAHWSVREAETEIFTKDLVDKISRLSGQALAECKRCIGAAHNEPEDGFEYELAGTRRLFANEDTQLRVRRFLDGREKSGGNETNSEHGVGGK